MKFLVEIEVQRTDGKRGISRELVLEALEAEHLTFESQSFYPQTEAGTEIEYTVTRVSAIGLEPDDYVPLPVRPRPRGARALSRGEGLLPVRLPPIPAPSLVAPDARRPPARGTRGTLPGVERTPRGVSTSARCGSVLSGRAALLPAPAGVTRSLGVVCHSPPSHHSC